MNRSVDRILAVSDLHGEDTKFNALLKESQYNPDYDLLVVCGDLIDRGRENLACLETCEKLQRQGAILLKGNHEQFLEYALVEMIYNDTWKKAPSHRLHNWIYHDGGSNTFDEIKSLPAAKLTAILRFIQRLPLFFSSGKFLFTHAGANMNKPIEENCEDEVIWMNDSFPTLPAYKNKILVFGHVPTSHLHDNQINKKQARIWYDQIYRDKIGIDCGSIFGGRLAALELPLYREFYI